MTIYFTTREYEMEHGRKPRGRGGWMFEFEGYEYVAIGTLTEAKKKCREYIKEIAPEGYTEDVYVNVLP